MSVAVNLSEELDQKLTAISSKLHKQKEAFLQEALESYIEDQEDYLLAAEAIDEQEKDGQLSIPFEEVKKKLDALHV